MVWHSVSLRVGYEAAQVEDIYLKKVVCEHSIAIVRGVFLRRRVYNSPRVLETRHGKWRECLRDTYSTEYKDNEVVADFILEHNLLDYRVTYEAIHRKIGSHLMADLIESIEVRFNPDKRRCHYGI